MKTILFDIETTPNISYTWGIFDQNVIAVKKRWELLSFSWKELGKSKVYCVTRKGQKTDKELTKSLWKVLSGAEEVIAHNGDAFDIKRANAKFIEHGLPPPAPFLSVDTLKIARSRFKFNSNRLDELAKLLGIGEKVKTGGFDLWLGCMANDPKAWKTMERYNKQDVILLEKVYLQLRPWSKSKIVISSCRCPKCNSLETQKRGVCYTTSGVYQRFQCLSCSAWSRDVKPFIKLPKRRVSL
jgi:uncharacterized protein YprB with RNaseH-like and TPR domain